MRAEFKVEVGPHQGLAFSSFLVVVTDGQMSQSGVSISMMFADDSVEDFIELEEQ